MATLNLEGPALLKKLKKFLGLDTRQQLLLARSFLSLGRARLGLSRSSLLELLGSVESRSDAAPLPTPSEQQMREAGEVSWAVRTAAANTPWKSTCLVQALAAQRMLRARNIAGALFVGADVARDDRDARKFAAHAWLKCGPQFVTGEAGHEQYKVLYSCCWFH